MGGVWMVMHTVDTTKQFVKIKSVTLAQIRKAIISDPDNAWAKKKGWEPIYTAHSKARILIVGQAPGIRAQESNMPWNDASGNNLRTWMGIDRKMFYDKHNIALVPMDFYFPGSKERGDLPPRPNFAEKWHPLLFAHMPNIQLTILLGQHAQKYYLGTGMEKNLTETVRNFKAYLPEYIPLVHPSPRNNIWQKKNPWFKKTLIPQLQKSIRNTLG